MKLDAELVLELHVDIGEVQVVGKTSNGFLRIIPITGGHFTGPYISGTVIPGGADWNTEIKDGLSHVYAKYAIKTDDGVVISVENEGYIDWSRSDSVIKTVPRFQVQDSEKYAWLQSGVFVASLDPQNGFVEIKVYKMK